MRSCINREQILDEFLKNVACLSDKTYQEQVWVAAEGPECADIEGTVCDFFDDGNPILENTRISKSLRLNRVRLNKVLRSSSIRGDSFDLFHFQVFDQIIHDL